MGELIDTRVPATDTDIFGASADFSLQVCREYDNGYIVTTVVVLNQTLSWYGRLLLRVLNFSHTTICDRRWRDHGQPCKLIGSPTFTCLLDLVFHFQTLIRNLVGFTMSDFFFSLLSSSILRTSGYLKEPKLNFVWQKCKWAIARFSNQLGTIYRVISKFSQICMRVTEYA